MYEHVPTRDLYINHAPKKQCQQGSFYMSTTIFHQQNLDKVKLHKRVPYPRSMYVP